MNYVPSVPIRKLHPHRSAIVLGRKSAAVSGEAMVQRSEGELVITSQRLAAVSGRRTSSLNLYYWRKPIGFRRS
jgi:hypothetical protein